MGKYDQKCPIYCAHKKNYYVEEFLSYPNRYDTNKYFWRKNTNSKVLYNRGIADAKSKHPELFQGDYKIISSGK